MSRDSSVGIGTRLGAGRKRSRGSISGGGRDFSLLNNIKTGSGAHPASYTTGTGDFFPRVKRQGREADHSSSSSAEVKSDRAVPPSFLNSSWCDAELIKFRDKFAFFFCLLKRILFVSDGTM
jgi:hypothetical protein